jgi:hypothetical protein
MSDNTHIRFFSRDGISQQQRKLAAIDPLYAKVDDRDFKELLSFLWKMAGHIQYYNFNNEKDGNWQNFIGIEKAVMLSLIAVKDTTPMKDNFFTLLSKIDENDETDNTYIAIFELLYNHCLDFKALYDNTSRVLGEELFLSPPNKRLLKLFSKKLKALYMGAETGNDQYIIDFEALIKDLGIDEINVTPKKITGINDFSELHQDLQKLFMTVINHANMLLDDALNRKGDYEPHIGLILSFLHLFKTYQDQLNRLTGKHLEFYYRDVLKINYREKIADKVYVLIQLAKQADVYRLEKNLQFNAGKDSEGKKKYYKACDELTVNKARVAELKSLYRFIDLDGEKHKPIEQSSLNVENNEFPMFANFTNIEFAQLGFAFSSPILRMEGGKRTITITIQLNRKPGKSCSTDLNVNIFKILITCDKGWKKISDDSIKRSDINTNEWVITFVLDKNFPPVIDYDFKIHSGQFDVKHPVCRLILIEKYENINYYELCNCFHINSYEITVNVEDLTNLILQNDFGLQKPEKPIMVFGNQPQANAAFYIGSREAFSKKLEYFQIKFDLIDDKHFQDLPKWYFMYKNYDQNNPVQISFSRLINNEWNLLETKKIKSLNKIGDNNYSYQYDYNESDYNKNINNFKELELFKNYSVAQKNGFIRINLIDNGFLFGHSQYPAALISALSLSTKKEDTTSDKEESATVNPPLTPTIQNIRLSYESNVSSDDSKNTQFFHLHPFGISREEMGASLVFEISEEGHFYIGLDNLKPPQNISLLFQFVEGTGDMKIKMPEKVQWSYLTENKWVQFDERGILKDTTRNFSGTGIVSLSVPENAVNNSSIMPGNYHWLRATVNENSLAVNYLSLVQAQAMELVFDDQGNASDHYNTALPPKSIGKLKESVASVKSVSQPFVSFGGRPEESRDNFFVRVSERLRHKDRAVTLWDYEHLVLEEFPQIHKVICLNHVSDEFDIAPGCVKVVVIPKLENLNAVNILQPAVSISLLNEIKDFLSKRCSDFVMLKVVNPKYDILEITADVTFKRGMDVGYYNSLLSDDIKDFLTPWKTNSENLHFYEKLHSSVILNFIEERNYVEYISKFKVKKGHGDNTTIVILGDIVRSHADSLFVSAQNHKINKPVRT